MRWRVVDTDIGRLFGTYDNEEEALALVRTLVSSYGENCAEDLAMGGERDDGSFTEPLLGKDLLRRAEEVAAEREHAIARRGEVITSRQGSGDSGHSEGTPMAARGLSASGRVRSFVESKTGKALRAPGRSRRRRD